MFMFMFMSDKVKTSKLKQNKIGLAAENHTNFFILNFLMEKSKELKMKKYIHI
jgi:hypothetical protein